MILVLLLCLTACSKEAEPAGGMQQADAHMELEYAEQFAVDYYGEAALITIGGDRFWFLPEGADPPEDDSIPVIRQSVSSVYLASSSVMDLFLHAGAIDAVRMTSTDSKGWTIPVISEAVASGEIRYVGKYSAPDYETVLEEKCDLAVENTMIYHNPEIKEQLESLGVPVMVERSSYESHPLGRVEWIKLYGLLTGHYEEAERFFNESKEKVQNNIEEEPVGKTVSFFYITASGYVNVRKPADYIAEMIEMAGGTYLFPDNAAVDDNALSTMNLDMETFYAAAKNADILIYNSTVEGRVESIEDLIEKNGMLAEFRAVQNGMVWCTNQNMFQEVSGTADMLADLHSILAGDAASLRYLYRIPG